MWQGAPAPAAPRTSTVPPLAWAATSSEVVGPMPRKSRSRGIVFFSVPGITPVGGSGGSTTPRCGVGGSAGLLGSVGAGTAGTGAGPVVRSMISPLR